MSDTVRDQHIHYTDQPYRGTPLGRIECDQVIVSGPAHIDRSGIQLKAIRSPEIYTMLMQDLAWLIELFAWCKTSALRHAKEMHSYIYDLLNLLKRLDRKNLASESTDYIGSKDFLSLYTSEIEHVINPVNQARPVSRWYWRMEHVNYDWTKYMHKCVLDLLRQERVDCSDLLQTLMGDPMARPRQTSYVESSSSLQLQLFLLLRSAFNHSWTALTSLSVNTDEALQFLVHDKHWSCQTWSFGTEVVHVMRPLTIYESSFEHLLHTLFSTLFQDALSIADLRTLILEYTLYFAPCILDQLLQPLERSGDAVNSLAVQS